MNLAPCTKKKKFLPLTKRLKKHVYLNALFHLLI